MRGWVITSLVFGRMLEVPLLMLMTGMAYCRVWKCMIIREDNIGIKGPDV